MDPHTRRTFLRAMAFTGAAWAATDLAEVEEALAWAMERRGTPAQDVSVLTSAQAADVDAIAARILPSDDGTPGAREAGVVHFIDRALATFNASQKPAIDDGLRDLNERVARKHPGTRTFAALTAVQQDALLREIEQTPFFNQIRIATISGMFALPSYGGNRDYIGWTLIGHEHKPLFQPPFGYYDAEVNGGR